MEHRVEHAVGPLQLPAGKLAHPFEDGVAVGVTLGQNGEDQGRGSGGDEVFVDVHCLYTREGQYLELLYIILLCISTAGA